jgi:hypothetical protein
MNKMRISMDYDPEGNMQKFVSMYLTPAVNPRNL